MMRRNRLGFMLGLVAAVSVIATTTQAQEAEAPPDAGDEAPAAEEPEALDESALDEPSLGEPASEEPAPEQPLEATPPTPLPEPAQEQGSVEATASVDRIAVSAPETTAEPSPAAPLRLTSASHIRRSTQVADGAPITDTPLRMDVHGGEYLRTRRHYDGIAVPDTAAALGVGAPGLGRLDLRLQPTLVLLNGRRLVAAPVLGPHGRDFVDVNQLPIQLIGRAELTSGLAAGLWGADAMGGVANFVTRRDIEGIDVELGGQATDKFDQGDFDVAVTLGTGEGKTGGNLMLSYFNRQPLAATDRDWIGEREDRVESLLGAPANYQKLINGDYPISDPYCNLAQNAGYSTGYEIRVRGFGVPANLDQFDAELRDRLLMASDGTRGLADTRGNGQIDALETSTYCAIDNTLHNDLILKDERIQSYGTFWHGLSAHTEVYGEAGFYRSENENRTSPAFPVTRLTPDPAKAEPLVVPAPHADNPVLSYGFAGSEQATDRAPSALFLIGATQGAWNGDGVNERRVDVLRGVLGVQGDLAGISPDGPVSSWKWDLAGTYSRSDQVSRVNDTLMDALGEALAACAAEQPDPNDPTMTVPTTIKQRQEAGCYSPFFSSVINNAAVNPLNVSAQTAASVNGFITEDSDSPGSFGSGVQDGGYICDPNDPDSPPCPDAFDPNGDGVYELAGTPNTKQVIDRITGEHFEVQQRTLATVGIDLNGDIMSFNGGSLAFDVGTEYRRESLFVDYDQAYNERQYGFLFGGDDIDPVSRDVFGVNAELRLRLADGMLELQPAAKIEAYEEVGLGVNALLGAMAFPFKGSSGGPLEYLGLRAHAGIGAQPPSLIQLYGQQNEFVQVDFREGTQFIAHQVSGNPDLDFEKFTTIGAGPQWDYQGIHVGADFWMTFITDIVGFDNSRTLTTDCEEGFARASVSCPELVLVQGFQLLDHLESRFDNMADVDTNGIDGTISYTLDTKRRGFGEAGTFVLGVTGSYINSYLIKSPRALAPYYRDNAPAVRSQLAGQGDYASPIYNPDGSRDYSQLTAEYEAAGFRNYENFAPPIPKLRFAVPLRWLYQGHTLGATVRFVDSYYDDSEYTIEKRNLPGILSIQFANGEKIPAWVVLDGLYGYDFDADGWKGGIQFGVLNILDKAPPAVESPLGYEVGIHDPRGRTLYARVSGDF